MEEYIQTCRTCKEDKPLSEYHRDKSQPSGHRIHCKACCKIRRAEYYATHRDHELETMRAYHKNNHEERLAYITEYRKSHRDYFKQYRKTHLLERNTWVRNRRAKQKDARGEHSKEDIIKLGESQGWRCWWCQEPCAERFHVDHRVPTAKGGTNDIGNLVIACPFCNQSKGAKLPDEWANRLL